MSHQWIDPNTCQSLAVLVDSVAGPLLVEHSAAVCLEVDIDPSVKIPADPVHTADLIAALVKQSLLEMPSGGDLTFSCCQTDLGVELEVADTGSAVESRATRLPLAAAVIGAAVTWQNCPQGGAAATVKFHRAEGSGRMAA